MVQDLLTYVFSRFYRHTGSAQSIVIRSKDDRESFLNARRLCRIPWLTLALTNRRFSAAIGNASRAFLL